MSESFKNSSYDKYRRSRVACHAIQETVRNHKEGLKRMEHRFQAIKEGNEDFQIGQTYLGKVTQCIKKGVKVEVMDQIVLVHNRHIRLEKSLLDSDYPVFLKFMGTDDATMRDVFLLFESEWGESQPQLLLYVRSQLIIYPKRYKYAS